MLAGLHGCFSGGTLLGALVASAVVAGGVPVVTHLAVTGAAPDHPVGLEALEGAYLKAVWLRVGDRTATPSMADDMSLDDEDQGED